MNRNVLIATIVLTILSLLPIIGYACDAELSQVSVNSCTGSGELLLYVGEQTQDPETSFTVQRDQVLIFTKLNYVSWIEVKIDNVAVTPQVVLEKSTSFGVNVYAVSTTPGSVVSIKAETTYGARAIQGYLAQDSANPYMDVNTIEIVYDEVQDSTMQLLPGVYNYIVFDKYTKHNGGSVDNRYVSVYIEGPEGVVYDLTYRQPFPTGTEGVVVDSFTVEGGSYLFSVDTDDSTYLPLFNCPEYECYKDSACEAYCDGSVRYYDGVCSEGTCSYQSQDCGELTAGIICSGAGTDTLEGVTAEYDCSCGECLIGEPIITSWTCDVEMEYESQECGGDYYYCYYDDGYVWGESWPEFETDCYDGHDNDNDDLIDGDDDDCYECFANEDCDDSNACTIDECVLGACTYTCVEDGTECDDGNSNTVNDACYSGSCVGETDNDGDGYGDDDCDDSNPAINPGAEEVCCDEIDNDCDGEVDEGCECSTDEDCDDFNVCTIDKCVEGFCTYTNAENGTVCNDSNSSTVNDVCMLGVCGGEDDDDGDGYGDDDCDDSNPDVHPGAIELCANGVDDDCDGQTDCKDSDCSSYSTCLPRAPSGGGGGGFFTAAIVTSTECGNDKCEYKENCINCPEDCKKADEVCCANVTYSGECCTDYDCGAGFECTVGKQCQLLEGGAVETPCLEDWTCSNWSVCLGGKQKRTCVDQNDCDTVFNKTAEMQECVEILPITGLFAFMTSPLFGVIVSAFVVFLILFLWRRKK
ncbi:MAG: putative metal-binding motif-containing protein [Candidatus Aenigmatarchaeota archaeon]